LILHNAKVACDAYGAAFCARMKRSVMHKKAAKHAASG